jgi:hypothetical protein
MFGCLCTGVHVYALVIVVLAILAHNNNCANNHCANNCCANNTCANNTCANNHCTPQPLRQQQLHTQQPDPPHPPIGVHGPPPPQTNIKIHWGVSDFWGCVIVVVTVLLQCCYSVVTVLLQCCYSVVLVCFGCVLVCYSCVTVVLQCCYSCVTVVTLLQGGACFLFGSTVKIVCVVVYGLWFVYARARARL